MECTWRESALVFFMDKLCFFANSLLPSSFCTPKDLRILISSGKASSWSDFHIACSAFHISSTDRDLCVDVSFSLLVFFAACSGFLGLSWGDALDFIHEATALLALCHLEKYSKRSEMVAILSCWAPVVKTWTFLTSGSSGEMSRFTLSFLFGSSHCHKKGGPLSHRESIRSCGERPGEDSCAGFLLVLMYFHWSGALMSRICCNWLATKTWKCWVSFLIIIGEDNLAICVRHLRNLVVLKLFLQWGTDPFGEQSCRQFESRDRNRFLSSYSNLANDEAAVDQCHL